MNIFKFGDKTYKYESFWRDSKNQKTFDSKNSLLPFPVDRSKDKSFVWQTKDIFLKKLETTQKYLIHKKDKFIPYQHSKDCLICGKKNITTGLFQINNVRWENGLVHYVQVHNIQPTEHFIDLIFRTRFDPQIISRKPAKKVKGTMIIKENRKYLKITRNQIFIMDALMKHGSYKHYVDKYSKKIFRYSEHAGIIDFDSIGVEKIIVSGKTNRVDSGDDDIYQPKGMVDMYDYEYIFHTHPATPRPGGRASLGVLYEFPSISDLFHFMDHYNEGRTQGSIVIAAEGMYVIRRTGETTGKINIDEDDFFNKTRRIYNIVQKDAIKKFGTTFTNNTFYTKIAPDKHYIGRINKIINKFDMHIDYYFRIKDKLNRWVIDTVYLPIFVIEPKSKLEQQLEFVELMEQMN